MVHIKKLELRGFKSFGPRKVTISLGKGYTVVSGPNGSGKSNVIDAIRFVLGEFSARSLRAARFSEVIFDGGQGNKKSESALVVIHLDNTDRRIPVDVGTVTVSRRVNRNGQSVYALNGRTISRSQLVDILSVGGIHPKGHNIIMQGTVTRLADLTSEDRRKIVEDLTGIAEYDVKKSDAQVQLNQAEFNLRVAAARIEEVEKRIAALERERNDTLRHNFLSNEIRRLRGLILSSNLEILESELADLQSNLRQKRELSETLRGTLEDLRRKREKVESDYRDFNENIAGKGAKQLFTIQENIGDINAQIAGLQSKMNNSKASLNALSEMRDKQSQQTFSLRARIEESQQRIVDLSDEHEKLDSSLKKKESENEELTDRLEDLRKTLTGSKDKLRTLDEEIKPVTEKLNFLEKRLQGYELRSEILLENLDSMEGRYSSFSSILENLTQGIEQLQRLREDEKPTLAKLDSSLERSTSGKQSLRKDLPQAEKTALNAKEILLEFETKKDLLDLVSAEEKALSQIEEMAQAGALRGVLGRIKNILKIDPEYDRSIEAALSGWMKAIVVKDLEAAALCIGSLRRMRLGRIKLIPLKNIETSSNIEVPRIDGVLGLASSFVKTEERFSTIAQYLLGDTLIVVSEDLALELSSQGYRCVTQSGDLFEVDGRLESGFFRSPVDLSSLLPSILAIRSLRDNVGALEEILLQRRDSVEILGEEESRILKERLRRLSNVQTLGNEIKAIQTYTAMVKNTLGSIEERLGMARTQRSEIESISHPLESDRKELSSQLDRLKKEREALTPEFGDTKISELGAEKTVTLDEIASIKNQISFILGEISTLQSNLENSIVPELERSELSISSLDSQITELEETIRGANIAIGNLSEQLDELEKAKERLSASLSTIQEERRRFERMLDEIDDELSETNSRYEPANKESHEMELEMQKNESEYGHMVEDLRTLGFEGRLETDEEDMKAINAALDQMRDELTKLGSVNYLAVDQYDQQKDAYKQLSLRRNEVEAEKISILNFMEEIEQKKRRAFMEAYSKINVGFKFFFSRLTGGGNGWLELENPEDPFSGGLDIYVQFPGKGARLVSGASGGEKSVAAVSFMFAIQDLSPAPFYVFDEVDAHLDIHNAERLANMLRENSAGTQFIVISLRDVVIDRAQKLFGVYVHNGVSRILSIKLQKTVER